MDRAASGSSDEANEGEDTAGGGGETESMPQLHWSDVPASCGVHGLESPLVPERAPGDEDCDRLTLTFSSDGRLATVDGASCEYVGALLGETEPDLCDQIHDCGGCEVLLEVAHSYVDDTDEWEMVVRNAGCGAEQYCDYELGAYESSGASGSSGGAGCTPACGVTEYCSDGQCVCPDGCRQGTVCCGGAFCAGDCVGTPCCRTP